MPVRILPIRIRDSAIAALTSASLVGRAVAQAPEQPALDHQDRLLDLGIVPRPSRPARQNGGAVVRRHVRIAAIDPGL